MQDDTTELKILLPNIIHIIINYPTIFYVSLKTSKFSYFHEFPIIRQFNTYKE
jgi:hypothetical protein